MSTGIQHFLAVAAGGAIGASGRHLVNMTTLRLLGHAFPWGTFIVNVVGSFAMGIFIGGLLSWGQGFGGQNARLFLATGVLGGFTTFSAFSLDVAVLWQRGEVMLAAGYVAASMLLSILAVFFGLWIMRGLQP